MKAKICALILSVSMVFTAVSPVAASADQPQSASASADQPQSASVSADQPQLASVQTEDGQETDAGEDETDVYVDETEGTTDAVPQEEAVVEETQEPTDTVIEEETQAEPISEISEEEEEEAGQVEEEPVAELDASAPAADMSFDSADIKWLDLRDGTFMLADYSEGEEMILTGLSGKIIEIRYPNATRYYTLDDDGYLLTGQQTCNKNSYYFLTQSEAKLDSGASGDMDPSNSTLGSMALSTWIAPKSGYWYYYGSDGQRDTSKTGLQTINGYKYYLSSSGAMAVNKTKEVNGYKYAFDKNGRMVTSAFFTTSAGNTYYFKENGRQMTKTGWQKIDGKWYRFTKNYAKKKITGFKKIKDTDGKTYTFYFKNGNMYASRFYKESKKRWYYLDADGHMLTGRQRLKVNGKKYTYYFRESKGSGGEPKGTAATGWTRIGKRWYFFSKSNKRAKSGNKLITVNKRLYYFDNMGRAFKGGFKTVSGKKYYFRPQTKTKKPFALKNRWISSDGKKYRAGSDGALLTGWNTINAKTYYFSKKGVMQKNKEKTYKNKKGWLGDDGVFVTNSWVQIKSNWKYISKSSGFVTGWNTIGGYKYYFTKDGYLSQDVRNRFAGRSASQYKIVVDKTKCMITVLTKESSSGKFNTPVVSFICSPGNPISLTPNGTYTATKAGRWQELMGPSWGQYALHVVNTIYIHSVAGSSASSYALSAGNYNMLGSPASHGCIRVCVSDAKWLWENASTSQVSIYTSWSSPTQFDKPSVPLMSSSQSYDPTDPAVSGTTPSPHKNPYSK